MLYNNTNTDTNTNATPKPKLRVYLELLVACVICLLIMITLSGNLSLSLRSTIGITGLNPLLVAMTINIATLFGLLLIVQTLPGIITYSTGVYTPKDMLRAGFWLTLASLIVMVITSLVWWPIIGLN